MLMADQAAARRNSVAQALAEIAELIGDRLSTGQAVCQQHGQDLTWDPGGPPDAVAFVKTGAEVQGIVRICARYQVPVIPFGTGTSLEGHIAATRGGVSIDVSQMNAIIQVNVEDLDCRVEPGVTRKQLNSYLRDTGLFFPIDPGADASIGGMAATRASGTNAVRYGTMRDNVLNLTVVLANGEMVRTARRARKSAAGYDLTRLFVGSEGTLGVITEIALRLHGIPQSIIAGVCPFPSVEAACNAVIATIQMGIPVARIELADEVQIKACNAYSRLSLKEQPTLFVEFHGSEAGTREQSESFGEIAAEYGGGPFEWAAHEEDRAKLWQARHDVYYACLALRPGCKAFATDVCVPISRLAECVGEAKRDLAANGLVGPIVGHVGDGNFHVSVLIDPDDAEEVARAKAFYERLILGAIAMDGTCTGEHGVGRGKMRFLEVEHGTGLNVMRAIKRALDPADIMNPGKIVSP
jgi:D-lactate dehydrogenase (cytochrome)